MTRYSSNNRVTAFRRVPMKGSSKSSFRGGRDPPPSFNPSSRGIWGAGCWRLRRDVVLGWRLCQKNMLVIALRHGRTKLLITSLCDPPLLRLLSGEHRRCLVFSGFIEDICLVVLFTLSQTLCIHPFYYDIYLTSPAFTIICASNIIDAAAYTLRLLPGE